MKKNTMIGIMMSEDRKQASEDRIQQEIVIWFRNEFRRGIIAHVPNQNQQRLVSIGVLAGFPDLIVLYDNGTMVLIEVKEPGKGVLSPKQKILHERLKAIGHRVFVVYSKKEAIEIIEREYISN